ncbi:hypothetical protein WA026_012245 [Henosepilachna vigintioctopunctata]|uniref:Exosome complex component 10 homolog n=1 Tax=Henosepilachna vigintioctopunctata TaxID=420089 RepID=A0AAW1V701_9CUCU
MNEDNSADRKNELVDIQNQSETHYLGGYNNMADFTSKGLKILMDSIRYSNTLPSTRDYDFYNVQESFKKAMSSEGNHILTLMNRILKHNGIKDNIKSSILDHKTELLIEANDLILEKVANSIDEMNGIKISSINTLESQTESGKLQINGSWNNVQNIKLFAKSSASNKKEGDVGASSINLLAEKNIIKPQKFFKDKIENGNIDPWEPKIKEKPNSRKPLFLCLEETYRGEEFSHPYEFELDHFQIPSEQLSQDKEPPSFPKSLAETRFVEIYEPEKLDDLVNDLKNYKIIAVDLEHHSYRSFMGITCLMQISTNDTDYIIDTIKLRDKLYVLNEVFTKPSILKVFHGADSDILWLQRDLALYIVNMFDTHHASKLLEYPSLSLSYLLERYCKFKPDKHFQLADWRMRPLPDVLKEYARTDTHYLIYIYQMLKEELLKRSGGIDKLLNIVYERSTEICKRRYFKQKWTEESHLDFYRRCKRMFDNRQMYALKEIYRWRDELAREEDESTSYVLPNHMLLQIAETLPREMQGILACCNPVPPLVRSNLLELHNIILIAREKPVEKLIMQEDTRARGSTIQLKKVNMDNPLYCPHDLSKEGEFRDDLPVLLNNDPNNCEDLASKICDIEEVNSIYSIFGNEKEKVVKTVSKKQRTLLPFERYQLVKLFIQDEEKKKATENESKVDVKPIIQEIESKVPVVEIEDDLDKVNESLENLKQQNEMEEQLTLIRKHFKLLTKKSQEDEEFAKKREEQIYEKVKEQEQNKSLNELGGTKKRKRIEMEDESLENLNIEDHKFLNPAPYQTSKKYVPLGQKRKHSENDNQKEQAETSLNQICKRKKIRNKFKAKRDNIRKEMDQSSSQFKRKEEKSINNSQKYRSISTKKRNTERNEFSSERRPSQEDSFEAFDYSSVDFRQFQGGAGSVNQSKNIKSKFKSKGRRKDINKAFNKSGMFSNSGRKK